MFREKPGGKKASLLRVMHMEDDYFFSIRENTLNCLS
jgi:hypothetical protein